MPICILSYKVLAKIKRTVRRGVKVSLQTIISSHFMMPWLVLLLGCLDLKTNELAINALTAVGALMTLIDFTLSNARRFYSSMGNPLMSKCNDNYRFYSV